MNQKEVIKDNFIGQEINLSLETSSPSLNQTTQPQNLPKKAKSKRSFLPSFNNDIILPAIAIGCILGVILFYFQGLQPLILKSYGDAASKKIVQLKDRYTDQIGPISALQKSFDANFQDNSDKVCSQQTLYTAKKDDIDKIDRLKLSLVPDASYKTVPNSGIFYNSDIQNVYQNFFNQYVNSLQEWGKLTTNLATIPNFLDYKNAWITACQKIEGSNGDLTTLKDVCATLISQMPAFDSLKSSQFWEQIGTGVDGSLARCYDVTKSTSRSKILLDYGKWRLDWLTGFDRIVQARPVWDDINVSLNKTSENLLSGATSSISKISDIVDERRQFVNLWYILEFQGLK